MGSVFKLQAHNVHEIELEARRLLFHIPSSALFEADPLSSAVIEALRGRGPAAIAELQQELGARFGGAPDGLALGAC